MNAPAAARLRESAPAKLNLYLHVVGRRADGYHELDSLAAFVEAGDVLTAVAADDLSLAIDGPFAAGLSAGADNLVMKAAAALRDRRGAALTLTKNLPVASGIGGGSADAAAALRLLRRLWRLDLAEDRLAALGLTLGADVPVCLRSRPTVMRGIGEVLSAAPDLPPAGILLVNPRIPLATPDVFRRREGPFSAPVSFTGGGDVVALVAALAATRNDLETPASALCPAVPRVLAALRASPGCRLARLSGSGATCFGLYDDAAAAERAAAWLTERERGWWVRPTRWFS